jgi:hypothetical protein
VVNEDTFAKRVADSGMYDDQQAYNSLKESHEREIEATRKLYESKKRELGEAGAKEFLQRKGFNLSLLK